ncbi:class II peroxidase [Sphaerobolus stellatus SS14]|uniref:Class II peroxidase n=1 Tax=Sphaerobolus stellatus (strain SS14) TaxID=990650 RepID=A0A0C9V8Z0_SPHS4|nr:class II peroxidase [Sphaerobolus stellatus SS14]
MATAPDNTIPLASNPINQTLARFVGFALAEIVALLAAHSIASSSLSNTLNVVRSMDSTPLVFNNQFFKEVLLPDTFPNNSVDPNQMVTSPFSWVIHLKSDAAFAAAPQTSASSYVQDVPHRLSVLKPSRLFGSYVHSNSDLIAVLGDIEEESDENYTWDSEFDLDAIIQNTDILSHKTLGILSELQTVVDPILEPGMSCFITLLLKQFPLSRVLRY